MRAWPLLRCMSPLLVLNRPTGRADQCPQFGVVRTQHEHRVWTVFDPKPDLALIQNNSGLPKDLLAGLR
jgi:hypothetical protein